LWPKIRFKFSSALRDWHPADDSAKVLLAPWKKAFGPRDWDALMVRAIIPKLESALAELQINPAAQDLEPFEWVMKWTDLLSTRHMTRLLLDFFFPKWFAALRHWLSSTPNQQTMDDVTKWYLHWKALFPDNILALEGVKDALRHGLETINRASCGKPLPTTWNPAPPAKMSQRHDVLEEAYGPAHFEKTSFIEEEKGEGLYFDDRPLRELVEQFAAEVQVDFLPKMRRLHEGLQVYSFGLVSCTVDSARQSILAQMGGSDRKSWIPVSMEQLLNEHKRRLSQQQKGNA
jgi:tuftelin-interacting protein 11